MKKHPLLIAAGALLAGTVLLAATAAQARPTDPFWRMLPPAKPAAADAETHLGGPFHGPRQTIPTRYPADRFTPASPRESAPGQHHAGPRNTVPRAD